MAYNEDKSINGDKGIGKSSLQNHQEEEDYEVANVSLSPGPGYEESISTRCGTRFHHYIKSIPESGLPKIMNYRRERLGYRIDSKGRIRRLVDPTLFEPNLDFAGIQIAANKQLLSPLFWEMDCMNRFSNEMFKKLAITEHRNESISPFSIHVVLLIMVSFGVNLDARNEINKALNPTTTPYTGTDQDLLVFKLKGHDDYFKMVSGVFVNPSLKINILTERGTKDHLKALIEKLNFKQDPDAQRRHINNLTCPKTDHNISELFTEGSIDANTEMVLASSVNFKLAWAKKIKFKMFDSSTFWNSGTIPVQVNMMYVNPSIYYYHDEKFRYSAIMLPFHVDEFSMIIILPDDKDGLKQFDFTKIDIFDLFETDFKTDRVHVYLPSFKIDQPMDFKEILSTKFNCSTMFKKGLNFEDINRDVQINKFMHKTYVHVHEQGIGDISYINNEPPETSHYPGTTVFNADHPFAYYIMYMGDEKDKEKEARTTGLILSGGVVTKIDPVKK